MMNLIHFYAGWFLVQVLTGSAVWDDKSAGTEKCDCAALCKRMMNCCNP